MAIPVGYLQTIKFSTTGIIQAFMFLSFIFEFHLIYFLCIKYTNFSHLPYTSIVYFSFLHHGTE